MRSVVPVVQLRPGISKRGSCSAAAWLLLLLFSLLLLLFPVSCLESLIAQHSRVHISQMQGTDIRKTMLVKLDCISNSIPLHVTHMVTVRHSKAAWWVLGCSTAADTCRHIVQSISKGSQASLCKNIAHAVLAAASKRYMETDSRGYCNMHRCIEAVL